MHMHMFWHAPKLTQPSHRNPGSAMIAELSVGNVTNTAAKRRKVVITHFDLWNQTPTQDMEWTPESPTNVRQCIFSWVE